VGSAVLWEGFRNHTHTVNRLNEHDIELPSAQVATGKLSLSSQRSLSGFLRMGKILDTWLPLCLGSCLTMYAGVSLPRRFSVEAE
jgi:hypothetical protein